MNNNKPILQIKNLTKEFDGKIILNNNSLDVSEGEVIGLLGVNGAGKTTLLKLLSGFLEPTEGNIIIMGNDPWKGRDKVLRYLGILIETPIFYDHLTAKENLTIHLEYMGAEADIDDILNSVGLDDVEKKPVSKFSLGMKQRLSIARAISHKPKILLLDEPINGLDPVAIANMRELFLNLSNKGTTIILSSHILGEILLTAESIAVISKGKLEHLGYIESLKQQYSNNLENYLIERMRG